MDIKSLYREIVNEHNLHPTHKHDLKNPTIVLNGVNPSCGDDINLQLTVQNGVIEDAAFNGSGCAVSQASADMMCDLVIGRTEEEALHLASVFMGMIKGTATEEEKGAGRSGFSGGCGTYACPGEVCDAWLAHDEGSN